MWSQLETKKYPYTTIDDNNRKIVIMTVEQADLINKKYQELQTAHTALQESHTTLKEEHLIVKQINETQGDTIVNQLHLIRSQRDTIAKYTTIAGSLNSKQNTTTNDYYTLQDSLWKWSLGPSLIYTEYPDDSTVYVLDLSHHYMATDDFGIIMVKMSDKEYAKYLKFTKEYGLDEEAFWSFRNNMKIKRLSHVDVTKQRVWKYKTRQKE